MFLLLRNIPYFNKSYGVNCTPIQQFIKFSVFLFWIWLLLNLFECYFFLLSQKIQLFEKSFGANRTPIGYFVNFLCGFWNVNRLMEHSIYSWNRTNLNISENNFYSMNKMVKHFFNTEKMLTMRPILPSNGLLCFIFFQYVCYKITILDTISWRSIFWYSISSGKISLQSVCNTL